MVKPTSQTISTVPLDIVGSTNFGRYNKISVEETFNMIISDDALVPYAGYNKVLSIIPNGSGRGIYSSAVLNKMTCVINNNVYLIDPSIGYASRIASIDSYYGDVYIDENNTDQIAYCDQSKIYIYNYVKNTFTTADTGFRPTYITYQDTRFIANVADASQWRLSQEGDGTTWPVGASNTGLMQTKASNVVATLRVPGKGNLLFVFGNTVTEAWYDLGYTLFPYQKSTYFYIDYGCLSAATIAAQDDYVVWLAQNEKAGPIIMLSDGNSITKISNEGIDYRLSQLTTPSDSSGFFTRQFGHLIYQLTFPTDNFSLIYDFNTKLFFTVTDQNLNYHIARRVAFFNDTYYFVSQNDGNLYEMTSNAYTYNGDEIPRIRKCKTVSSPSRTRFVIQSVEFPIEQGQGPDPQRVDMQVSYNGGDSFGSFVGRPLNAQGTRQNRLWWPQCGSANEFTPQFRFCGTSRFVAKNGETQIYQ